MSDYQSTLDLFMCSIHGDINRFATGALKMTLPVLSKDHVIKICSDSQKLFASENILLEINAPLIVVGDIHGHILDLFRILQTYGFPPKTRYLFLGDLVDRGEFSIETILIVFLLKLIHPTNVFLIRGNHEFEFLCSQCGFQNQVEDIYNDYSVVYSFLEAFAYIPLAARINEKILAVHGGIGPQMYSLSQIRSFARPIHEFGDDNLDSLLWSDPTTDTLAFTPSTRGTGYIFGEQALNDFISSTNLKLLIRGHECVATGCEFKFNEKLITVFSASNYCGLVNNEAGVLNIKSVDDYCIETFPSLPYLTRMSVNCIRSRPNKPLGGKIPVASSVSDLPQMNSPQNRGARRAPRVASIESAKELPKLVKFGNSEPEMAQKGKEAPVARPRIAPPVKRNVDHRKSDSLVLTCSLQQRRRPVV